MDEGQKMILGGAEDSGAISSPQTSGSPQSSGEQKGQASGGQNPPALEYMADKDGNLPEGWRGRLPEAIRDAKCLDTMSSVQALATSYVNAQRMIGANKMVVPTEKSSAEEWGAAYDAMGRPKEAKDYDVPEGFLWDSDAQRDAVLKSFHDAGLNKAQGTAMLGVYRQVVSQAGEELERRKAESEGILRREWGLSYEANIAKANRALSQLGILEPLRGNPVLNDAGFIRALADIGGRTGETSLGGLINTPSQTEGRLDAILNDRSSPYYDASHPLHGKTVAEVARLMSQMG